MTEIHTSYVFEGSLDPFFAMRPEDPPSEAAQVIPPKKQFLTEDQLLEIWELRGMKYRFDELHLAFLSRGLLPTTDRQAFRELLLSIMRDYLVEGRSKRDPKHEPIPRFPKVQ